MSDAPSSSGPDFTKVGFGAMGNVDVKHDASVHTTHSTSQVNQTHHEDKSTHHNHHVTHHKTTHVEGMHPLLVVALVAVVGIVAVLLIMVMKPASQLETSSLPKSSAGIATDNEPDPHPRKASEIAVPRPAEPAPVQPVIVSRPTIVNADVGVMVNGEFTPRTSFKSGELLTLRLRVSRTCQVRALYQPAQGDPMLVFPESGDGSSLVAAGTDVFIPDPAKLAARSPDATAFKLFHDVGSGPPIQEQVVVQIADAPFLAEGATPAAGTPYRAYAGSTLSAARLRGISRLKGADAVAAQTQMEETLDECALTFSIHP